MTPSRTSRWLGRGVLGAGFVFLYLPIVLLVAYSFNASKLATVWAGFSTQWYGALLEDRQMIDAALVSLEVGFWSASASVVLGTMAALVMTRFRDFRGRTAFNALTAPCPAAAPKRLAKRSAMFSLFE